MTGVQTCALPIFFELPQAFIKWQNGLLVGRPHVGPDQAVMLLNRVPGLAHLAATFGTGLGLAGLLHAVALHVKQPTVVAAANAAFFDLAVVKRRAPVCPNADTTGRVCPFCRGTRSGLRPAPALCAACRWRLIPIRIKNDNCVASPCRAAALSAASRLVLLSNANLNYTRPMGCQ